MELAPLYYKILHKDEVALVVNEKMVPSGKTSIPGHCVGICVCPIMSSLIPPPINRNKCWLVEMVCAVYHPLDSQNKAL